MKTPHEHIEDVFAELQPIYEQVANRISAMKSGEKILGTELAKEIGKTLDKTGPQIYPIISFFLKKCPGIEMKRGPKGGIHKL